MQTTSYNFNNEHIAANTSRQVSGMMLNREQSSAGAVVRSGASYATQPTYQATTSSSYAMQPHGASTSYHAQSHQGSAYASQPTYNASAVSYSGNMTTHTGDYTSASRMMTGGERVQSTRKISSTVIDEQYMGSIPQDLPTREVEVQGPIQEVVKHVTKKEVIETEKRVPKYEYEWVERIVEIPRIEYVDKTVEIPQYQEVIREVKVPQIVEVPKEVVKEVKVPKINYIEQIKEVPGQIIEVPKPYTVENKVEVTRYTDKQHPVVVAQTIKPYIVEGSGVYEVDVYEYEPECVPVDVHVVKAVQAQLNGQLLETSHRVITVPVAQYNTMLQQLNVHLQQGELQKLPYLTENGQVTFLNERITYIEPQHGVRIEGLDLSKMVVTHEARGQVSQSNTTTTSTGMISGGGMMSGGGMITGGGMVTGGGFSNTSGMIGGGGFSNTSLNLQGGSSYHHPVSAGYQGSYSAGSAYIASGAGRISNAQYSTNTGSTNMLRPSSHMLKYPSAVVSN